MESIIALPNDYVVLDIETTGLDYKWDDIIEVSAVRYREGKEMERFDQLVGIPYKLPAFITELTGITDEMLKDCPYIEEVIKDFSDFLSNDLIIGHNVSFDVRFLAHAYDTYLKKEFQNQCVDTMRIARKVLPDLQHHRLRDLAEYYGFNYKGAHRSGFDCDITNACYQNMKEEILAKETEEEFRKRFQYHHAPKLDARDIHAATDEFDPDHPLCQKTVVFTGALSTMTRAEAMQMVVNCGGLCGNGVTKNTNFLVVGTSDFISATEGKKTSKMLKVEQLRAKGYDIASISEGTFFDFFLSKD